MLQRKQQLCELLTVLSASSSMLAVTKRTRLEFEHFIFSDDNGDGHNSTDDFLLRAGTGFQVLASMLSSPDPRGPYNQWRKCYDFFEISLSWPDRDFRHEYRYVQCHFN